MGYQDCRQIHLRALAVHTSGNSPTRNGSFDSTHASFRSSKNMSLFFSRKLLTSYTTCTHTSHCGAGAPPNAHTHVTSVVTDTEHVTRQARVLLEVGSADTIRIHTNTQTHKHTYTHTKDVVNTHTYTHTPHTTSEPHLQRCCRRPT